MMQNRTILTILIILLAAITFGCVESSVVDSKHTVEVKLRIVDIGFRDGSYQQVNNVMSWQTVETGTFSNTIDMKIINQNYYAETRRIHYVTSIDIIEERIVTLELNDGQYQSIMSS